MRRGKREAAVWLFGAAGAQFSFVVQSGAGLVWHVVAFIVALGLLWAANSFLDHHELDLAKETRQQLLETMDRAGRDRGR